MPLPGSVESSIIVEGTASSFTQEILAGPHRLMADEPVALGGTDRGPTPYDLLLAALGACTSMTGPVCASQAVAPRASPRSTAPFQDPCRRLPGMRDEGGQARSHR